jgi:hypothetical protein
MCSAVEVAYSAIAPPSCPSVIARQDSSRLRHSSSTRSSRGERVSDVSSSTTSVRRLSSPCKRGCQLFLPRPVLIPKQLGLGFNKTGQQRCFQLPNPVFKIKRK